jgi:hypothetical protein
MNNNKPQHDPIISLGPYDIICGRCSTAFNNIGNRRFRVTISLNVKKYIDAPNRQEKKKVIQTVVDLLLRELGAKFLKRNKDLQFVEVSERLARQKVQHALRDMAAMMLFPEPTDGSTDDKKDGQPSRKKTKSDEEVPSEQRALLDDEFNFHLVPFENEDMLISTTEIPPEVTNIVPELNDEHKGEKLDTLSDNFGCLDGLVFLCSDDESS